MKIISLILFMTFFSVHGFGEQILIIPSDEAAKYNLNTCKKNHLIILGLYKNQITSQINRLINGVEYEYNIKTHTSKMKKYENFLLRLILKKQFISVLEEQLKRTNLETYVKNNPHKSIFNLSNFNVDLDKEIGINLNAIHKKESFKKYLQNNLKGSLQSSSLKYVVKTTYKAVGSGALIKILTEGISSEVLKSAVTNMYSTVISNAVSGSLVALITIPLHSYRYSPEALWVQILEKHPELLINPEWMRLSGSSDEPWSAHLYAMLEHRKFMGMAVKRLLKIEENSFQESIIAINKISTSPKFTSKYEFDQQAKIDNLAQSKELPLLIAPFWAKKTKQKN